MTQQNQSFKAAPGVNDPWYLPEYPDCPIYAVIPARWDPERPIGLFFFMHGGDNNSPPDQPYKTYLNEENGVLQPHIADIPFITIAPAALPGEDPRRWNNHKTIKFIFDVIEDACSRFNIDRDRIVLGGHSMGGFGAYHFAPILADRFAAFWLSAGGWQTEDFRGCLGTPLYLMHDKWDCAYHYRGGHKEPRHHSWCGVSYARAAHELMLEYDVDHVYDEHTGGHGLDWEPSQLAFKRFLRWAARQKRNPYASRCAVITPNGSDNPVMEEISRSRWLEITETVPGNIQLDKIILTGPEVAWHVDDLAAQSFYVKKQICRGARLIAENMGNNTFEVEAENIRSFKIFLHSEMADLDKDLQVNVNGKSYTCRAFPCSGHPDYTAAAECILM